MNITRHEDEIIMNVNQQDKELLQLMGLQFCLNAGINEINGNDVKELAKKMLEEIINAND
jgi:hypothetical protein